MKIYSKRKYSLLDHDSLLYEDFWIEEITSGKLLGILLDKNLSWDNQVDKKYKYLNSRLYLFKRICPSPPLKCRMKLTLLLSTPIYFMASPSGAMHGMSVSTLCLNFKKEQADWLWTRVCQLLLLICSANWNGFPATT